MLLEQMRSTLVATTLAPLSSRGTLPWQESPISIFKKLQATREELSFPSFLPDTCLIVPIWRPSMRLHIVPNVIRARLCTCPYTWPVDVCFLCPLMVPHCSTRCLCPASKPMMRGLFLRLSFKFGVSDHLVDSFILIELPVGSLRADVVLCDCPWAYASDLQFGNLLATPYSLDLPFPVA